MEQYEYIFRWYTSVNGEVILQTEKHIYASELNEAKRQVEKEWPALKISEAHIERVKGNGTTEPLPI